MKWVCSFCGKKEDNSMVHTTCIEPEKHYFFCKDCFNQWQGFKELVNENLIQLKIKLMEKK